MKIALYNIFLVLYRISALVIGPWNHKARLWVEGRKNIFEKIRSSGISDQPAVIWMHCASLGEFEQGRPLLEHIAQQFPSHKIILTFFSPSGFEAKKKYPGADYIFYLPLDSKHNAKRFIDMVRPKLVLWVKYEYWFYYLDEIKKRNISALLVSGVFRKDQIFFKWYGSLHRYMLQCFSYFFVQTELSKRLLGTIGITDNVAISGDTRFDRVIEIADKFEPVECIGKFCGDSKVIVAGSTWEEDEEQLDHYANTHPEIKFIIAPHEIDEQRLKEVEMLFRFSIRFSELQKQTANSRSAPPGQPNVLIVDNIGMLANLYKYATIAYVGGGFGDDGVHNVLEASVFGKPVVHGPVIEKYVEATELVDCGGGFVIDSALEAEETFNRLLSNEEEYLDACNASAEYVRARKGATEKIMQFIQANRLLTN
ncbi:MAG TPA: glycosyltransferase N-terminal domain-containing protein [Puia sp.]|jgi:3-deoxy-D-manno-octulosonic-acid transferase|nr:glycosyltransferase N-terminal domain-containing protein [Puia sp.]